jgi:hypothetical protein
MKGITALFLLFLSSCYNNASTNCIESISQLLKMDSNNTFISKDFTLDSPVIKDRGKNGLAGEYSFFKNGNLKSYKFFASLTAYTYNEEYDVKGQLLRTDGIPLVKTIVREVNKDSVLLIWYLFSLNKTYQEMDANTKEKMNYQIELKEDTTFSNMKRASFGFSLKDFSEFEIYIHTKYRQTCNDSIKQVYDTLSLIKKNNVWDFKLN